MNSKKKWILIGAGDEGIKLKKVLKKNNQLIYAFVDNNISKVGKTIDDIPIISFENFKKIYKNYEIVISVSNMYENEIIYQVKEAGIDKFFTLSEIYDRFKFVSKEDLRLYHKYHKDEDCFIIGTGPSLRMEDLETIQSKEITTFASNRIFKIYNSTSWRPDYYFVTDYKVINEYYDEILDINDSKVFMADIDASSECRHLDKGKLCKDNFHIISIYYKDKMDNNIGEVLPCFSDDASRYVVDGGLSVTYAMIQWAAYMGFKKIYLIGVDFFYNDKSGLSNLDHMCDNYLNQGEVVNQPNLERCERAYKRAELYSRENGFRIYNATRGGKLEVFERVDFDSLFGN